MDDIKRFIEESIEVIKRRSYQNEIHGVFFTSLCDMLKAIENIALEYLDENDSIHKEINDLKKILCSNE